VEASDVEPALCATPPRGSEPVPELWIAEESSHGLGKRSRVSRWNEETGLSVDYELRRAADVRCYYGQPGGHRLENRDGEALGPA